MSNSIVGKEYALKYVFSKDFIFHVPKYQRPYAWTEEESITLFEDLYDSWRSKADSYFLGSVVLVKRPDDSNSNIIDGQQRLTTLLILFSVFENRLQGLANKYLFQEGDPITHIKAEPRMRIREQNDAFFQRYIIKSDISNLLNNTVDSLSEEPEKHILLNCKALYDIIDEHFKSDETLKDFYSYVLNNCYLIMISTQSDSFAHKVFSIINTRGLDLLPQDILKSEIIGDICDENDRNAYNRIWEDIESALGRNEFNSLLSHIRTIYTLAKQQKTLQEEIEEILIRKKYPNRPKDLIDEVIMPYSKAYGIIINSSYPKNCPEKESIESLLRWLNMIDNSDWVPPALVAINTLFDKPSFLYRFLLNLEKLAAYMMIARKGVNERISRFTSVIRETDGSSTLPSSLNLSDNEKEDFISILDGNVYELASQKAKYIILKLDSFKTTGGATYNYPVLTIEHVLPQTPASDSQWVVDWTDDERSEFVNRIGNLVILTRRRNSAAQNYDFDVKKEKYFDPYNTSPFPLTLEVMQKKEWTPNVVRNRQKDLIKTLTDKWVLFE